MQMCQDILASETSRVGSKTNQDRVKEIVKELVKKEVGTGKTISVSSVRSEHNRGSRTITKSNQPALDASNGVSKETEKEAVIV